MFVRLARTLASSCSSREQLALLFGHVTALVQAAAKGGDAAPQILLLQTEVQLLEHGHRIARPGRPP